MIEYVIGDATLPRKDSYHRIIAHVCNDVGAWGRGFTASLSRRFGPIVGETYKQNHRAGNCELGLAHFVDVSDEDTPRDRLVVANLIAQHGLPSRMRRRVIDYDALERCLTLLAERTRMADGVTVHLPRIGCGIAGGDWRVVGRLVQEQLEGIPVTVYDWPPPADRP